MKQALVFADRDGRELNPLNENYSPAMLPIAGRPVLENTLILCQAAGIDEIWLVTGDNDFELRSYFESGARWSLVIKYLRARAGEHPANVRKRIGSRLDSGVVVLRGDIYRSLDLLTKAPDGQSDTSEFKRELYDWISEHHVNQNLDPLAWPPSSNTAEFSGEAHHLIKSLKDYHYLATNESASAVELIQPGAQSDLHHSSIESGTTTLGDYSRVEIGARLNGNNAIGSSCLISRGAALENAVIMNGSFVGSGMQLSNCIVDHSRVMRVDLGVCLDVEDPFFVSSNANPINTSFVLIVFQQALAAVLLLLTHCGVGFFNPTPEHRRCTQRRLARACKGEIRLFGRPRTTAPDISPNMPWTEAYLAVPEGAISPAELQFGSNASPTVISLAEIESNRPLSISVVARLTCAYFRRSVVVQ
ncbi:sugar phosphate nucleotidyltransferase [Marinobacter sp. CA1]|uniref:sugar phosphate nucleotidyltransferase n=1 Tax=Marinobacter sp. CA1 TaxID=2817656 RepID=UPI001D065418|nr:NDP-sugar synthase [Marinobacter sp. CA1]UDL07027.1 NDP-sugar synthase [Marinobacter sp. CA1]